MSEETPPLPLPGLSLKAGNGASVSSGVITCASTQDTERLAEDLAMILQPGDCVCLSGDLGAGKSTFARAVLRALADDDTLEVPSPTFTLVQSYSLSRFDVAHLDLYRLEEPEELGELGLEDALETGIALIEWPERGAGLLPASALSIRISGEEMSDIRHLSLHGPQALWGARIARTRMLRAFLDRAGYPGAVRRYLQGDASPRGYETIRHETRQAILMNAPVLDRPPRPDEAESYAEKVHLARDLKAVVAIGDALRNAGFSAPEILAADCPAGVLLQSDLGRGTVTQGNAPICERYLAATDLLATLHQAEIGPQLILSEKAGGGHHDVPPFDIRAMQIEADLLVDWYLPYAGVQVTEALRSAYHSLWKPLLEVVGETAPVLVLRDFHSPNLIWRDGKTGHDRIGLVDYQDAVMGSDAYDVASLAMDARVTVPHDLEKRIVGHYLDKRRQGDPSFDAMRFHRDYAIMAAQRASKILGIFVRLSQRDGKPAYLRHIPRVRTYLTRAMAHPDLAALAAWMSALGLLSADGSELEGEQGHE